MSKIAFVLKGYPRLSETFIAQEIRGLELRGLRIEIISLRPPRDLELHPVHREIASPVTYLPERLRDEPLRVAAAFLRQIASRKFIRALGMFLRDWRQDPSTDRVRRFGQGLVLAAELSPDVKHLHAHFLHTPASVTQYASVLAGLPWTCSAHAKDIWTTPDWEKRVKLADMQWLVTCTKSGLDHLAELAPSSSKVSLLYHGIDLDRFGDVPGQATTSDGSSFEAPVQILSVGRAVAKKGFDVLIDALARLPSDLSWRWSHIGEGDDLAALKAQAEARNLGARVSWLGARPQADVLAQYRQADLFVLPCRIADDGDRDGLPNVLMEAMSQSLPCISTPISGIPELIEDGVTGVLVAPDNADALAAALRDLISQPERRQLLGSKASAHVRRAFNCETGFDQLAQKFHHELALAPTSGDAGARS